MTIGPIPQIYDITTDSMRDVTQEDIDNWMKLGRQIGKIHDENFTSNWTSNINLACFPNRFRPGRVFVAEDLPIEPYPMPGIDGKPIYPAVPITAFKLGADLPVEFANELVKRWNSANK